MFSTSVCGAVCIWAKGQLGMLCRTLQSCIIVTNVKYCMSFGWAWDKLSAGLVQYAFVTCNLNGGGRDLAFALRDFLKILCGFFNFPNLHDDN